MRQLTLSTEKDKYGIRLKAEPDHMVLGKRLKGAFKSITASIRELTSEQLEDFQKSGMSFGFLIKGGGAKSQAGLDLLSFNCPFVQVISFTMPSTPG